MKSVYSVVPSATIYTPEAKRNELYNWLLTFAVIGISIIVVLFATGVIEFPERSLSTAVSSNPYPNEAVELHPTIAAQSTQASLPLATSTMPPTAYQTNKPSPAYTVTPYCPGVSWSPRFKRGDIVKVCTIKRLRFRNEIDGEVRYWLLPMDKTTTTLELLDGPHCGENAWYWHVKLPAGSRVNDTSSDATVLITDFDIEGYVMEGLEIDALPNSQGYYLCKK